MSSPDMKLGGREYLSLVGILIGIKMTDATPMMLHNEALTASWMIPLLSGFLATIVVLLAQWIMTLNGGINLTDVIFVKLGRSIGLLIGLFFFLAIYSTFIIDARHYVDTISLQYYPQTPKYILLFMLLTGCIYNAWKGITAIGSVFRICFPFILFSWIFLFFISFQFVNVNRIFPLLGRGIPSITLAAITKSSVYMDLLLLLIFYPQFQTRKSFVRLTIIGGGVASAAISAIFMFYIALYGAPMVKTLTYPYHELTRYIRLGSYLTHLETFFMFFWLIAVILRFSFYLYCSAFTLGRLFKNKPVERFMIPLSLLAFPMALLPKNIVSVIQLKQISYLVDSVMLLMIPVVLLAAHFMKGSISK